MDLMLKFNGFTIYTDALALNQKHMVLFSSISAISTSYQMSPVADQVLFVSPIVTRKGIQHFN